MVGVLAVGWVIWGVVFVFGGAQHQREVFGRFQSVGCELEEMFLVHAARRACYAQGGHDAFPVVEDRDGNCENLGDSLGQGDRKSFVEHGLELSLQQFGIHDSVVCRGFQWSREDLLLHVGGEVGEDGFPRRPLVDWY